jgi:hypothetical protein
MLTKDPIKQVENIVNKVQEYAGSHTRPVLARYPLLFAFLITFSVASILHGFELFTDSFSLFREHPTILLGIGVLALILTGTLYKKLSATQ